MLMNKKRIISWFSAIVILLLFAIYSLSMLTIKTQEVQAECIHFWLEACGNSGNCCSSGSNVGHVFTGTGAYSSYFSMCVSN